MSFLLWYTFGYFFNTGILLTVGCPDGYWGITCWNMCPENCKSCYIWDGQFCYQCNEGYYKGWSGNIAKNDCSLKCPTSCKSCTSNTVCSSCNDGFYNGLRNNQWYGDCSLNCESGCKTCSENGKCTVCKDGYFGLFQNGIECGKCRSQCTTCTGYDNCNECNIGYYGSSCQHECSTGCSGNICNKENGHCSCFSSSFWGQTCENVCSKGCISLSCNKSTGECTNGCKKGYIGERCNDCETGFERSNGMCTNCNSNCATCSAEGLCIKCTDNYGGDNCQTICPQNCQSCNSEKMCLSCKTGYYGINCSETCPLNCLHDTCNMFSGNCFNCKNSFTGNRCLDSCPTFCFEKYCKIDGSCFSCHPGMYGFQCENSCPNNCTACTSPSWCSSCLIGHYANTCDQQCTTCLEGTSCRKYDGYCETGCKDGWYNVYCLEKCDQRCKACERYYSNRCSKCADGRYGQNNDIYDPYLTCDLICPTDCLNNTCDERNGQCTNGCVQGKWGHKCNSFCQDNCLNGECYHNNGSCIFGCKEGYKGGKCDCPTNCECTDAGTCTKCITGFKNLNNKCLCRTDVCLNSLCLSCTNNSFYAHDSACCPCNSNCKDSECTSATNCSHGCESGYYGYDCAANCADVDPWCAECPINYGKSSRGCHRCKPGYYPFEDASYGYNRCLECPNTCSNGECDGATGECITDCVDKKWGLTCQEDCGNNCLKCDRKSGDCYVCEGGKYLTECSRTCTASCNKTDGQLLCAIENGACLNGCVSWNLYGAHCEKNCSNNCKENVCSWLSGDCVKGCQNNHWGKQCEHVCSRNCISIDGTTSCNETNGQCLAGCLDGYYSAQCEKTCSINCFNTSCDARGRCVYGCSGDFVDDSCLQDKFEQMQDSGGSSATIGGIVGGVVVMVIIIGVVIVVVVLKRRHRKDESSAKKENHHSNNAVRFSEVAERRRQADIQDSVPVYATPDKSKIKKDTTQSHTVNNPNYQKPSVALKQSVIGKVAAVYENAVLREVEDSKLESDTSLSHENLTRVSKTRQSLGKYLQELEDPDENAGSSSTALVLETSGSNVKESEVGDTYYNTAEVFKRKIPLEKLAEFVDNKPRECFEEEFKLLPEGLIKKYTESQKKDNITKNRYRGIYPYDDTRVVLRDGESDYINASYIDGYTKLKAYIASLGPTYKYMDDMSAFWRMVWQEKCGKIIMLTNLMEGGTRKCDQYWPEKDFSQLYADINVTCLSEETYADYTVRVFNIQKESAKRNITQVHFTAWPDQGVPDDVMCLIEFRQRVMSVKTNLDGPILVHCSAGIGRTGTYIALDCLTKEGESEGNVDIYACVRNLREQRVNMVQTAEQYEYLHKAVVHSLTFDSHAIEVKHFQQYMTKHDIKTLAQKFHDLEQSVEKRSKDENEAVKKNSGIKEKNRVGADIPGDRNRPRLYLNLKPGASDYINALYVNSYRHVNRFILAQTPLPGTVDDFLTLVVQEKCSCIVSMEPETNKSKDVGIYYPADNQTLKRGLFTLRTERMTSTQNFTHRSLTISTHGKAGTENHIVQHFQLASWVDDMKCPNDAASFLDFLHHVEFKSGGAEAGPVLVHCLTSAEKCGLFCVVSLLLEKIQSDQEVSVVNTVRQVKSRRHRAIPSQEQYVFCHQCVNEYIRSFDNYSNFASRQ